MTIVIKGWLSDEDYGKPCAREKEVVSMAARYLQQFKLADLKEDADKAKRGVEEIRRIQAAYPSFTNTKK